jgi:hypothetical protein
MKKGYGWAPDLPDHRDKRYGAVRKIPAKLPSAVDLRPHVPSSGRPGATGQLSGNAPAGALEFLEMKNNFGEVIEK